MKILVIEDDFERILESPFQYLNAKFYSNQLIIENHTRSQDFHNIENINDYIRIFVDISLAPTSEKDGFSFIRSLIGKLEHMEKIVILTGSDNAGRTLLEMGLGKIKVLTKPISFLDLKQVMPN